MSPSFPPGCGRNSTLSNEDTPHEASQSGHGGSHESSISASHQDQDCEGRAGFRDKQVAVDGISSKIHVAWQVIFAPLNSNPHIKVPISCEIIS